MKILGRNIFCQISTNILLFTLSRWINEIISEINIRNDEGATIENAYFAPSLERILILILTRIPLWSNIMVKTFKSKNLCATSSGLESYFKNLKHLTGNIR